MYEVRREKVVAERWQIARAPIQLGEKFLLLTSWQMAAGQNSVDRMPLIIDPGPAFPPYHATTQIAARLLEKYWCGGRALDVGAGSGALAIMAARLMPGARVDACDIDDEIIEHARESMALNDLDNGIELKKGRLSDYRGGNYALIIANLLAPIIVDEFAIMAECLAADGLILISGIPINSGPVNLAWSWQEHKIYRQGWQETAAIIESRGFTILAQESLEPWRGAVITRKR